MTIQMSYNFPCNYDVELLNSLPVNSDGIKIVFFPQNTILDPNKLPSGSIIIRVISTTSTDWVGIFAPGYIPSNAISQISSCPNPNHLCVVNKGQGYIIDVFDPSSHSELKVFPIHEIHFLDEFQLILFVDFTHIVAHDFDGVKWITEQLSSDGLKVTLTKDGHIKAFGWDAISQSDVELLINTHNGKRL